MQCVLGCLGCLCPKSGVSTPKTLNPQHSLCLLLDFSTFQPFFFSSLLLSSFPPSTLVNIATTTVKFYFSTAKPPRNSSPSANGAQVDHILKLRLLCSPLVLSSLSVDISQPTNTHAKNHLLQHISTLCWLYISIRTSRTSS